MDQGLIEMILWGGGALLTVITGLLGWIGMMQRESKQMQRETNLLIAKKNDEQDTRLNGHDEQFKEQQKEIYDLKVTAENALLMAKMKLKIK